MPSYYDHLFSKTAVLCLSRNFSQRCWSEFCPNGGVCYEFDFDSARKAQDVTCAEVTYSDMKIFNAPRYFIANAKKELTKALLSKASEPSIFGKAYLLGWSKGQEPRAIGLSHVVNELTFKKLPEYEFEAEFRYVHLTDDVGPVNFYTRLVNSKLGFDSLGLSLIRIHTSDVETVRRHPNLGEIEVVSVDWN